MYFLQITLILSLVVLHEVNAVKTCKPIDQCSCELEGEGEVSLHAIDHKNSPL